MGIQGMEALQSKSLAAHSGYPSGIKARGLPDMATSPTQLRVQKMSSVPCASAALNLCFSFNRTSQRMSIISDHCRVGHYFKRANNSPFSSPTGGRGGGQGGTPLPAEFVRSESWLIASHPAAADTVRNCYYHSVTRVDPQLQRRGAKSGNLLQRLAKVPASSIFSWLTRKRRILGTRPLRCMSTDYQWRTDFLLRILRTRPLSTERTRIDIFISRFPKSETAGAIRSTSSYLSEFGGNLSSQAAKDRGAALEESSLLDQKHIQRYGQGLRSDCRSEVFLATGLGWRVRDAERGELRELVRVADIQTSAFHERSAIFDELFHKIFHAEVLASLQYKSKQFDPKRYACLLAEMDPVQPGAVEEAEFEEIAQTIVGAVDVTALDDKDILCHLPGADEYLYVSGMAVDPKYRRRGVATLLLEACLARAVEWSFNYLVLHAYENDFRARNLYSRAGYNVVGADPAWMSKFLGRRRRVVMAKRLDGEIASPLSEVF